MSREEGRTQGPRRQADATPVQGRTRPTLGFRPRPAFSLQDKREEPSTSSSTQMTLLWSVRLLIRTHLGKLHCVHLTAAARPPSLSWVGGPSGVVPLWVPGPPCPRESPMPASPTCTRQLICTQMQTRHLHHTHVHTCELTHTQKAAPPLFIHRPHPRESPGPPCRVSGQPGLPRLCRVALGY